MQSCTCLTCIQGVKLYIEVLDADNILPDDTNRFHDDNIIDQFYISITSQVGVLTSRTVYNGIHGFATMELSFRVTCAQYYTGNNCENLNECQFNPGICNGRGQCVDEVGSYTCICEPRYTGSQCQDLNDCYVNSVNCSGHGRCVDGINSFICSCDPGYSGSLCQTEDSCFLNSVTCNGNGRCVNRLNSYTCECDSGYTGNLCEQRQGIL